MWYCILNLLELLMLTAKSSGRPEVMHANAGLGGIFIGILLFLFLGVKIPTSWS